eukprot:688994-Prymnesium_polylepis.1
MTAGGSAAPDGKHSTARRTAPQCAVCRAREGGVLQHATGAPSFSSSAPGREPTTASLRAASRIGF